MCPESVEISDWDNNLKLVQFFSHSFDYYCVSRDCKSDPVRRGEENIPQGLPGDTRIRERAVESGGGERV